MSKDTELLLPLGSVVRLKNGKELMMIQGFVPNDLRKKDTYYDYEGNIFVTGRQGDIVYMFNEEDIAEVLFIGYQTPESIEFRRKVTKVRNNLRKGMKLEEAIKETTK